MSDNRKYYYLKLKENFYNSETMVILESMQDGLLYSNLLLKMYLRWSFWRVCRMACCTPICC